MNWKVVLTPQFKQEFTDIFDYIAQVLLAPDTAKNVATKILDQVEKLCDMPQRFSLYDKEPWRSRGLRKVVVDNFVIFYLPYDKTREVVVFHVFYGWRNIDNLLDE